MKSKQIEFKNPFDLIDEEAEPMSIPTSDRHNKYVPIVNNVYSPLPFNPYQITKQQSIKVQKKEQPVLYTSSTSSRPSKITAPLRKQSEQPFSPTKQSEYQSQYEPKPLNQYQLDQNGDPPLLDDIGIEPQKIKKRIMLVLRLSQPNYDIIHDPDLSGPILIALTFGFLLLLSGKVHFGDIYAMFILGNLLIYFLLNFISQIQIVPLYSIMSTMGYGLLPMVGLGFIGIFISLKSGLGIIVALGAAIWASYAAGNFMDVLIKDTKHRKALVIYPLFLFYVSFTMIVIF